jgi:hypothetical protein
MLQSTDIATESEFIYGEIVSGGSVYNYYRDYERSKDRYLPSNLAGSSVGIHRSVVADDESDASPFWFWLVEHTLDGLDQVGDGLVMRGHLTFQFPELAGDGFVRGDN